MIDRAGQLWEYRPSDTFKWRRVVVLRSDSEKNGRGFIFHTCLYLKEKYRTDLVENLDHDEGRWENHSYSFRRIA
jgi:hypothetical protein